MYIEAEAVQEYVSPRKFVMQLYQDMAFIEWNYQGVNNTATVKKM